MEEPDDRPYDGPIVVLDFESTGLNTGKARIIEIGAVKLEGGTVIDSFEQLVDPGEPLGPEITNITGINDAMLQGQPRAEEALPKLMEFIGDLPIAAHNAHFDASLLKAELKRLGRSLTVPVLDTLSYARKLYPDLKSFRLGALCKQLGVSLKNAHRAVHDATATAHCLQRMFEDTREKHPEAVSEKELNELKSSRKIHLFVRKVDSEDGIRLPFTYIGEGRMEYIEGSKKANGAHLFRIPMKVTAPEDMFFDFRLFVSRNVR